MCTGSVGTCGSFAPHFQAIDPLVVWFFGVKRSKSNSIIGRELFTFTLTSPCPADSSASQPLTRPGAQACALQLARPWFTGSNTQQVCKRLG